MVVTMTVVKWTCRKSLSTSIKYLESTPWLAWFHLPMLPASTIWWTTVTTEWSVFLKFWLTTDSRATSWKTWAYWFKWLESRTRDNRLNQAAWLRETHLKWVTFPTQTREILLLTWEKTHPKSWFQVQLFHLQLLDSSLKMTTSTSSSKSTLPSISSLWEPKSLATSVSRPLSSVSN